MTTDDPTTEPVVAPRSSATRKRWRRLLTTLGVALAVVFALLIYVLIDARTAIENIPTTSIASLEREAVPSTAVTSAPESIDSPITPVDPVGSGDPEPPPPPIEPATVLAIGSDTREGLPDELGITDKTDGRRADVIMLATLENDGARILSLPRDLKVDIEGHGTAKLNAAYAFGGPDLMVSTVEEITGVEIDHYVEMDFYGFAAIVDSLGGVEITFPYPVRDLKSDLSIDAGLQHLAGREALAYARSRQYQELRDGSWVSVDANDLGRIRRQQSLLFAMLASAKRWSIIFDIGNVIRAAGQHMIIDASLTTDRMVDLLWVARGLDRENVEIISYPVLETTEEGVYYLLPDQPEATTAISAFLGATIELGEAPSADQPPRVRVLNGNGAAGEASDWAVRLEELGFGSVRTGDAASYDFEITVVRVRPDGIDIGQQIVDALGFGQVEAGSVDDGLDAVVIIGADALGV